MDDLVVGDLIIPAADLEETFRTSGGPGGQHANRSETAVRLRLDVARSSLPDQVKTRLQARLGDVIEVIAGEERSQKRNRERARSRMADRIHAALVEPRRRRTTRPTRASKERRHAAKRATAEKKRRRRRPGVHD